jgi:hypothetical protein
LTRRGFRLLGTRWDRGTTNCDAVRAMVGLLGREVDWRGTRTAGPLPGFQLLIPDLHQDWA